jgi:protoporphyrinogen oxidase
VAGSGEVVVVGGGPTGLTAAWRAAVAGHRVTLVERNRSIGGMAASIVVGGQRVDLGSHRLDPAAPPEVLGALRSLLGDDLQVRRRLDQVHVDGQWLSFPIEVAAVLRHGPRALGGRLARDAALRAVRRRRGDTFADLLRVQVGPTLLERVYEPYARKVWDARPEDLDGLVVRDPSRAARADARAARLLSTTFGRWREPTFLYPRNGFGQIVEALAAAAVDAGVSIRPGEGVVTVAPRRAGVDVLLERDRIHAAHVVWTAPLTSLVRSVRPAAPFDVFEQAGRLRLRSVVLVYLVLARPSYTPYGALLLPGGGTPVARVSEPKNLRDGPDPEGSTVLCAEVPCWAGDEIWRAEPAALARLVRQALVGAGLEDPEPTAVEVVRLPHVYPVRRTGEHAPLAAVRRWSEGLAGVTTLGRPALFATDDLHQAMEAAWGVEASLARSFGDGPAGGSRGR